MNMLLNGQIIMLKYNAVVWTFAVNVCPGWRRFAKPRLFELDFKLPLFVLDAVYSMPVQRNKTCNFFFF